MNDQLEISRLVEHLFRHESGKMVSVLTGIFGTANLELAEDVVQDTLIEAISHWTYREIPKNPTAWLYTVAKNKALNALKHEKVKSKYISDLQGGVGAAREFEMDLGNIFSKERISDEQLKMMFMCCHGAISKDSQVALILKTLCGFSIPEIARAFLTSHENINKRLVRARKKIREHEIPFKIPDDQTVNDLLHAVLDAIYLLFNEGYSASSGEHLIRYDLCEEAIRLSEILVDHHTIKNKSDIHALLALMQLNCSRFSSRIDQNGNIRTLGEQNRALWDLEIMEKGFSNLKYAAQSGHISTYHILASISSFHCSAKDFEHTDWQSILALYDKLLILDHSPIVVLNRAIAVSKVDGAENAIAELEKIRNAKAIKSNYLYHAVMAELHFQLNRFTEAHDALKKAMDLAPLPSEKEMLGSRFQNYFNKKNDGDVPNAKV